MGFDPESIWEAISKIKLSDALKGLGVDLDKVEADAHKHVDMLVANIQNSPQLTPEQKAEAIAKLGVAESYLDKVVNAALPSNLIGLAPVIAAELKDLIRTKRSIVIHSAIELA